MPQGDAGGHFASSGAYGGNFPGGGGATGNVSGAEHGMLGFGGMSPGGYNSTVYANNLAGVPGTPGFGARRAAYQAAARAAARQAAARQAGTPMAGGAPLGGPPPSVTAPTVQTPPEEELVDVVPPSQPTRFPPGGPVPKPYTGHNFVDSDQPGWSTPSQPHNPQLQPGGYPGRPRQFGGPVSGGQYTVGENGPETLQMAPGSRGQVIPNNPADRLGGMNPQMMQALFQLMQNRRGGGFGNNRGGSGIPGRQFGGPVIGSGPRVGTAQTMLGGGIPGGPGYEPGYGAGPGGMQGQPAPPAPPGLHSTSLPPPGYFTPENTLPSSPGGGPPGPPVGQFSEPTNWARPEGWQTSNLNGTNGPGVPRDPGFGVTDPPPPWVTNTGQPPRPGTTTPGPVMVDGHPTDLGGPPGTGGGPPMPPTPGPRPLPVPGAGRGGGLSAQAQVQRPVGGWANSADKLAAWQAAMPPGGGPGGGPNPNLRPDTAGGNFQLGDWRNRMGIAGLSRPPNQFGNRNMGFGGSALGMPGVMGQMRQRAGLA